MGLPPSRARIPHNSSMCSVLGLLTCSTRAVRLLKNLELSSWDRQGILAWSCDILARSPLTLKRVLVDALHSADVKLYFMHGQKRSHSSLYGAVLWWSRVPIWRPVAHRSTSMSLCSPRSITPARLPPGRPLRHLLHLVVYMGRTSIDFWNASSLR